MIDMSLERTTITIDHFIAERIRRMFNGNLSFGINEILHKHLKERNPIDENFGILKSKKSTQKIMDEIDRELWGEKK
ncbi:MAG: hypothetical protein V1644_03905 [Candidatus Micrarchaeota archaeon]